MKISRLAATLAACAGLLTGCITETEAAHPVAEGMRTSGVIVNGHVDAVWPHVQEVVASMTREPLQSRGLERTIATVIRGEPVMVLVEPHGDTRTAVHVTSHDQRLADAIQMRVMR